MVDCLSSQLLDGQRFENFPFHQVALLLDNHRFPVYLVSFVVRVHRYRGELGTSHAYVVSVLFRSSLGCASCLANIDLGTVFAAQCVYYLLKPYAIHTDSYISNTKDFIEKTTGH